jgi:hypothetical protein
MGLGSAGRGGVSLAQARQLATQARQHLAEGLDPIQRREAAEAERSAAERKATFGALADELYDRIAAGFKNDRTRHNWRKDLGQIEPDRDRVRGNLEAHDEHVSALRRLRAKRIDDIDTQDVLAVCALFGC